MLEVLIDSFVDALKILPFLFLVYVLIEVLENTSIFKSKNLLNKKVGPLFGSAIGVVPQCGFSVVATNLYSKKHISIGTLMAVYISTSDEAIPILLGSSAKAVYIIPLILCKVIFAIFIGYLVDFVLKNKVVEVSARQKMEEKSEFIGCCKHELVTTPKENLNKYLLHPILHSLKLFLYLFIFMFAISTIIYYIGIEKFEKFLLHDSIFQPILAGFIGLIPNCASSVLITELYIGGSLSFGASLSGLCVNAGIAYIVLFKENKNMKENIFIISTIFAVSIIFGIIVQWVAI